MAPADERLLTPAFVRITASALAYFIAIGVLAPVLPLYVEERLHGSGTAVGLAGGAFAVSAALLRPLVGRIGDEYGRKVLVLGGGFVAGVSVLGYTLATNLPVLVGIGVSTPAQALAVCEVADGVVVGSAVVRRLLEGGGPEGAAAFVSSLRRALDGMVPD